jgi:hypothetical protein
LKVEAVPGSAMTRQGEEEPKKLQDALILVGGCVVADEGGGYVYSFSSCACVFQGS